ncbi:hypothetical protein FB451DRAFT_1255266 [Mycena latifolia]|nr:hypothetical protein FB451DRAFT_1255266 [Mycena latifolia]
MMSTCSTSTSVSTPATLAPLVAFLTRPLARAYAPATVAALQSYLHTALAACIPNSGSTGEGEESETTLHLSPSCPPPAPLQAACLLTGVRWAAWARLLAAGLDLTLFVSQRAIAVKLGRISRRVLWAVSASTTVEAPAAKRVMLGLAARARAGKGAALHPTRVPTLLSSCISAADLSPPSPDEDESSDESDSESEYSSDFDAHSDSGSSVSSASSVSEQCGYPVLRSKADVKCFLYAGGATHVVSGGVMLGSAASARPSPTSAPIYTPIPSRPAPARPSCAPTLRMAMTTARKPAASWRTPARAGDAASWRRSA